MIVYTGGTFDLFHSGHVNFLRQCSQLGSVIVSLNRDNFVKKYKGVEPVIKFPERAAVLKSCIYVHEVIENTFDEDSKPSILSVMPNIIAIASDWARKDYYKQMNFTQDWLDEHGIILSYIPYTKGVNSTNVKERINYESSNSNSLHANVQPVSSEFASITSFIPKVPDTYTK